jgi:hypothetical protein
MVAFFIKNHAMTRGVLNEISTHHLTVPIFRLRYIRNPILEGKQNDKAVKRLLAH